MKKKIAALVLVIALAATAVIGGTLAYFTDTTETKTNKFTVGNVDIDLTEDKWDETATHALVPGVPFDKNPTIKVVESSQDAYVFLKVELNKYVSLVNLMGVDAYKNEVGGLNGDYPGFTTFMNNLLDNAELRNAVLSRWFEGIEQSNWQIMNTDEIKTAVNGAAGQTNPETLSVVLAYVGGTDNKMKANDTVTFMTKFGIPATVTSAMFDGDEAYKIDGVSKSNFNTDKSEFKLNFTAYAIQAEGIADLNAAYTELFPAD